ncbi:MAG: ATP-binding protein [Bacteroidota bacterium]
MKQATITLSSDKTAFFKLQQFVENICDYYNIQNTYFGNILVCLNEAVSNAIKHGNQNDSKKFVTLEMINSNDEISFTVSHKGNIFDFDALINKINPEEHKGLFLIKTLSDAIEYQNEGKSLIIKFNIHSVEPELKKSRSKLLSNQDIPISDKKNQSHFKNTNV